MKRTLIITLLVLFAGPPMLFADRTRHARHHRIAVRFHAEPQSQHMRNQFKRPAQRPSRDRRHRIKLPSRLPVHPKSLRRAGRPVYPGYKPVKPGHGRPGYWWPATTTVVRETQPIIIVYNTPPVSPTPPPKPEAVWVPAVMDTRSEPGYWDYGVKKVWMGNHWRYEQDHEKRIWVPASQVKYVKQQGYWKTQHITR